MARRRIQRLNYLLLVYFTAIRDRSVFNREGRPNTKAIEYVYSTWPTTTASILHVPLPTPSGDYLVPNSGVLNDGCTKHVIELSQRRIRVLTLDTADKTVALNPLLELPSLRLWHQKLDSWHR